MKKFAFALMLMSVAAVFAGVEDPFVQLNSFIFIKDTSEPYKQPFYLKVTDTGKVYLTNWVLDWNIDPAPLGDVFDMTDYGYIVKNSESGGFQAGAGSIKDVTYYNDDNPNEKVTTPGYLLGEFEKDTELFIVMTTKEEETDDFKNGKITSNEEIPDKDNIPEGARLAARKDGQNDENNIQSIEDMELVYADPIAHQDLAGNQIVNFGLTNGGQREFVAVLEKTPTKGQPLPGMILAGLLSLGTVAAGKKMRKRS